jgi:PAS domain S-box-containing protein
VILDITERRLAEERQAQLAAILEATTDFVGSADPEGRTLYINGAGRQLVGIDDDEDLSATSFCQFYPAWVERLLVEEAVPAATQHGSWAGETALQHRDGCEIPVSQVLLVHKNAIGAVVMVSTIARDIRARRKAEERIRSYQTQLRSMAMELALAEERERRSIATALHDLVAQPLALAQIAGAVAGSSGWTRIRYPV